MIERTCPHCGQGFYLPPSIGAWPEHADLTRQIIGGWGWPKLRRSELPVCPRSGTEIGPS